jgi:hypothetical protein
MAISAPSLNFLERHEFFILTSERIARLGQDPHQGFLVEFFQRRDHWKPSDELRDQPVLQQILGLHFGEEFPQPAVASAADISAKAHRLLVQPLLDNVLQADECAATHEQNIAGIDLNEFLMRVLASPLRRNVGYRAFD